MKAKQTVESEVNVFVDKHPAYEYRRVEVTIEGIEKGYGASFPIEGMVFDLQNKKLCAVTVHKKGGAWCIEGLYGIQRPMLVAKKIPIGSWNISECDSDVETYLDVHKDDGNMVWEANGPQTWHDSDDFGTVIEELHKEVPEGTTEGA